VKMKKGKTRICIYLSDKDLAVIKKKALDKYDGNVSLYLRKIGTK